MLFLFDSVADFLIMQCDQVINDKTNAECKKRGKLERAIAAYAPGSPPLRRKTLPTTNGFKHFLL